MWRKIRSAFPAFFVLALSVPAFVSGAGGDVTVYVSNTGRRYHLESCSALLRSKNAVSLLDAVRSGYEPCGICKPATVSAVTAAPTQAGTLYQVHIAGINSFSAADTSRMIRAEVTGHVDGDTVRVRIDGPPAELGVIETIRLIGVDTPETVHPNKPVAFFGREASDFTKTRLLGANVRLAFDWDLRDRYGRLLAYIYTGDGECFNAVLVREGYGHAYTRFSFQFMEEFRALEREAREARRGLWKEE